MQEPLLACNLYSYGKYQHLALEHLRSIGIEYVEVAIQHPKEAEQWLKRLEPYGLRISSVICPCDVRSDSAIEAFAPIAKAVGEVGARVAFVSVHAGDTPLQEVYRRLRRMGDLAAGAGVQLAMETHPDLVTNGEVALRTMQAVAHPNVGINFDTANIYYYNQGADAVTELTKVLPYVFSVHLKDTNGLPRTWYFPTLGEGVVDFKRILWLLLDRGMFGPFTMELEGIEGEQLTEAQQQERVARSYAYILEIVRSWQQHRRADT